MSSAQIATPKANRRWGQLSLRTLFLVVAVFDIALGLFNIRRDWAKRQQLAVSIFEEMGGWRAFIEQTSS